LTHMKGHSYFLFDPAHLDRCAQDNAFLVGDSLGLAHPLTAEGIVPAATSGRVLGEAIAAEDAASYATRLRAHPLIEEYRRTYRVIEAGRRIRARRTSKANGKTTDTAASKSSPTDRLVARGFAWMFSGSRMPAPKLVDFLLDRVVKEEPRVS
ncbi:MAG TPA: hypothetical protein VIV40_34355, partial [Kofleriaceae bacterium]